MNDIIVKFEEMRYLSCFYFRFSRGSDHFIILDKKSYRNGKYFSLLILNIDSLSY